MSSITEYEANELLCKAQAANSSKRHEAALGYYQKYLEALMEFYKTEPNGSDKRAKIISTMEVYMAEAERLKEIVALEKTVPDSAAEASQSSIFSYIFGSPKKSQNINKDGYDIANTASVQSQSKPKSVPDYHDYTAEMKHRKAAITSAIKTARAPTDATQQKAVTQRLHTGARSTSAGKRAVSVHNPTPSTEDNLKVATQPAKKRTEYETQILEEMLDKSPGVRWSDIAGLGFAKQTLQEAVILPNLRPDLFTGLRAPPKGVLLFGPPGTGKTMLAKAVASESDFCFFSISSSSVTSKYLGEGEKLMKALFEVARDRQPSVIFFDEIDALMSARKENEHEASRRLKTEFMTQVDGASTTAGDRLLIMAATNIPWEIDEAVLRRLVRRIYIPLPDHDSRRSLVRLLLEKQGPSGSDMLGPAHMERIVRMTEGYSGSDLTAVCQEAALGPIRELGAAAQRTVKAEEVRHINEQDFANAVRNIRPSVSKENLATFQKWADQYGVAR